MACRNQGDGHIVARHSPAVGGRLGRNRKVSAIAFRHDRQGLRRRQHRAVPGPGVIGMAMGDDRTVYRAHRINIEVARRAIEPLGSGAKKVLRAYHCLPM